MSTIRALKGLTATAAVGLLALGAAGTAAAQNVVTVIPGDNGDGRTVIVNHAGMDVEILSVDRAAGTVQVRMQNNLGFAVFCEAPNPDTQNRPGGTVTTADVVEMSAEYYSRYQNVRAEEVRIVASGSTITMDLWPLTQFFPQGSLGEMASDAVQLRSRITEENTAAKIAGLYGTTGAFQVANGGTVTRTINLGQPATQPRSDEEIGFFTVCAQGTNSAAAQGSAQLYAWSAFEPGPPAPPEDDGEPEGGGNGILTGATLNDG